jgi:hypothetical protein
VIKNINFLLLLALKCRNFPHFFRRCCGMTVAGLQFTNCNHEKHKIRKRKKNKHKMGAGHRGSAVCTLQEEEKMRA